MPRIDLYNVKRALPRMSWHPTNLFNLFKRSTTQAQRDLQFQKSRQTLFQIRWKAKQLVRGYHGDFIPEKVFKRWFLPTNIPDPRPRVLVQRKGNDQAALDDFARREARLVTLGEEINKRGLPPVGSLMFTEVERRLDVFIFRCCFAHSVYEARRMVTQGHVTVNGQQVRAASTRLAPGDLVSVNPKVIKFFQSPEHTGFVPVEPKNAKDLTPFALPAYASPWLFIPAYIEPSFATCSAVYVRHPTARPRYSEVASPYEADGPVMRFAWEWYVARRPRVSSKKQFSHMPPDRTVSAELIARGRKAHSKDIERMKKIAKVARTLK